MNSIDPRRVFLMFNLESHCTTTFKVERVMSFPARERKEGAMRNTFVLESTVGLQYAPLQNEEKRQTKGEKEKNRARQGG